MKLEPGKTRLQLVKEGIQSGLSKRGRLVVSLTRIFEDPHNERKTFRNMEGLTASIQAVGLIEPITVTPDEGDKYRIITGHRRYRAAKAAGLEQVEVLIRDPQDEQERRLKSLASNVQREDIGPVEMAEALESMLIEGGQFASQVELATALGKDKGWVSRVLRILDLPADLQKKLTASRTSVSYNAVAAIARVGEPDHQAKLVDALLAGSIETEIYEQIRQIKGTPPRQGKAKAKEVYHTSQGVSVIVQSKSNRLTPEQCLAALQEAVAQAREAIGATLAEAV